MNKIKVSVVSYINSTPFIYGLENSPILKKIEISKDIPSDCAVKLRTGKADIGIVPVGSLDDYPDYHIVSQYCIGANGKVDSVFLLSEKPIDEVKTVLLDSHSRTSNGLAKVLMEKYWQREVEWLEEGPADACVLIGDRTFNRVKEFRYAYDLAYYWKELTDLPFVFAVWVSTQELPVEFKLEFDEAIRLGIENRVEIAKSLPQIEGVDLVSYLEKSIDYILDEPKKEAMYLYLTWLRELNSVVS